MNGIQDTKQRALSLYAGSPAPRDKIAALRLALGIESIRLGDDHMFVSYDGGRVEFKEQIQTGRNLLNPSSTNAIDDYYFKSKNDLLFYINRAKAENLDSLWKKVKSLVLKL